MTSAISPIDRLVAGETLLTQRETEILHYLPTRLSNAEIGSRLGISQNTIKTHLKGMYRKLGVTSRDDAVEAAVAIGLLAAVPGP